MTTTASSTTEDYEDERLYDVVVWGASGYTGNIISQYMAKYAPDDLKWAIGGRNKAELETTKKNIQQFTSKNFDDLPILLGDNEIPKSIEAVVKQTRVILSAVGPYTRVGTNLVEACIRHKTDYCDLTGEIPWIRGLIDQFHDEAEKNGVRIVNVCGFNSIPADLGALYLVNYVKENYQQKIKKVKGIVSYKATVSGGTVNSIVGMMEDWKSLKSVLHPYYLNPGDYKQIEYGYDDRDQILPKYDTDTRSWTGTFVPVSVLNTRVVRRSQGLMKKKYGDKFRYNESRKYSSFLSAVLATLFTVFMFLLLMIPFIRRKVVPKIFPKPGAGPSVEEREKSWFEYQLIAEIEKPGVNGAPSKVMAVIKGEDPGYTEASKFVAESAICLALDYKEGTKRKGGVLTPASCLGMKLVKRLQERNVPFEVMEALDVPTTKSDTRVVETKKEKKTK